MKVVGFHGTTEKSKLSIEKDGISIELRNRRPKWLGLGFYLFQDAPQAARLWANESSVRRGDSPAVLKATIDLRDSVDLTDIGYWQLFRDNIAKFGQPPQTQLGPEALFRNLSRAEQEQLYFNYEDDHYVSAFVASLERYGQRVRSIRAAFIEGQPVHSRSWLFDRAHVQICVRSPDVIERAEWV